MKLLKPMMFISALILFQSTSALASYSSEKIENEIAQQSLEQVQRYAEKTGKATPEPVDYTYDMKLDIAKMVYMTPNVYYCGNVSKYMSYEDSQGNLNTVRYLVQGKCRNNK
ncbi:DUF2790 domain-containing protein [Pseudomonas sp. TTU2014-080ASC]|jgi:hypothetical protein|uniref:DUF2790 domain-containing protein n=1 Tax=Pseudomonas sp. TTU2014-080ASC TaxID=1729724 RepID=UPI0007188B93|nr:DUF2790 domain-containing protein [Pseudomonas sp. TTU2014-080ASC]KRW61029.1 hypothetical protein AO726_06730 [Pseudomonas sp. TTU2014-080ASC]